MTVRPVDMLTMIPRLNEANRAQHEGEQHRLANQQLQAALAPVKAAREQQQVQKKRNAEHGSVQQDGGRRGDARQNGKSDGAPRQQAKEKPEEPGSGHRLDVKV